MYGLVNSAIQGLVVENYGNDAWEKIKTKSQVNVEHFISNDSYPDTMTFELAIAASEVLGVSLGEVLHAFGEYWVLVIAKEKYPHYLNAGGGNLKDFLLNLPNFHARIIMIFPNLKPPEFQVTEVEETSLNLHYLSDRNGLKDFVFGLISGLGKLFDQTITTNLVQSRDEGADHEIFHIEWEA